MTAGVVASIAGYFWGLAFPVNENLWTSSFVLVTSGFAALLFGALYFLVDIKGLIRGTRPGIIFGANAITIYFLADVWALFFYEMKMGGQTLNEHFLQPLTNPGSSAEMAARKGWKMTVSRVISNTVNADNKKGATVSPVL